MTNAISRAVTLLLIFGLISCDQKTTDKRTYVGQWIEDNSKSSLAFLKDDRVEMRLFDILNASELSPGEIIDSPVNIGSIIPGGLEYTMSDWKVNDKPAQLTQKCRSSVILERTELISTVVPLEESPRRRDWGWRYIDAYYTMRSQHEANIYIVAMVGDEEMKFTIARATLRESGSMKLERDEIGRLFFTIEREFRKGR